MSDCAFHLYMAWVRIGTMRSFRSRPVGWRNESYRHYLAAKGMKSKYFVEKQSILQEQKTRTIYDKFEEDMDRRTADRKKMLETAQAVYGKDSSQYADLREKMKKQFWEANDADFDMLKRASGLIDRYQKKFGDSPEKAIDRLRAKINLDEQQKKVEIPIEIFPDDVIAKKEAERQNRLRIDKEEFYKRLKSGENKEAILRDMTERKVGVLEKRYEPLEKAVEERLQSYKEEEARRGERNIELQERREEREAEHGEQSREYLESQIRDMKLRRSNQKIAELESEQPESAIAEGIRNTKLYEERARNERLAKELDEDEL